MHVALHAVLPIVIAAIVAGFVGVTAGAAQAAAQTAAPAQAPAVAVTAAGQADASGLITCWWRTSAGSVRVGEPFSAVVTCAVADTDAVRVRVEESRLESSVMQLPPFDVIGGRRGSDVTSDGRRFLQFEYTLRLIAEQGFGGDVSLPPLQVSYRVERRAGGGAASASGSGRADSAAASSPGGSGTATAAARAAATGAAAAGAGAAPADAAQGRDLIYALPPLAIRIASVVPDGAADIREAAVPSLAEIEQVAFRATMLRVLAGLLFAFGALTLALAFVRGVRRQRAASPQAARGLSDRVILQGVRRELTTVQAQAGESGWTTDLAARALAAARIAAACAAGRPIAQKPARADVAIDGQLFVRDTFRLGRITPTALVSGALTAEGLTRALAAGPSKNGDNAAHSDLHAALAQFTTVCYGRASAPAPATRAGGERAGTNAQREPRLDASAMTSPAGDTSDARASSADGANPAALNAATEQALRAVDALAAERTWIAESRRAWTRALAAAKERVWAE